MIKNVDLSGDKRMQLDKMLEKLITRKKICSGNFIIYPFGEKGYEVKNILNNKYNIYEAAIIDEHKCKTNKNIYSTCYFDSVECKDKIILITSDNIMIHDELREEVQKRFSIDRIIDLFGPVIMSSDQRVESLRLCAEILNRMKVPGAVAEAGVYNGEFAKFINNFFKERKLYLFDTFEGFKTKELIKNVDSVWAKCLEPGNFYISKGIESVMEKMKYPEKVHIRKGYFPNTTEGIKDKFCFVNLDMDIYQSTKDGLEFFWPRMEKRGIIFVHDYVSDYCPGVKQAVDEFCLENEVGIGCIPDYNGTVMLIK